METLQGNSIVAEKHANGKWTWAVNPKNLNARRTQAKVIHATEFKEHDSITVRNVKTCWAAAATGHCDDHAESMYNFFCKFSQPELPDATYEEKAAAQMRNVSHVDGLPVNFPLDPFCHFDASAVTVDPVEPVDSRFRQYGGRCLLLRNVLTPTECELLIQNMNKTLVPVQYRHDYRQNDRCIYESTDFAKLLWQRVQPFAKGLVVRVEENPAKQHLLTELPGDCPRNLRVGYGHEGNWHPIGLNECLRFCRYDPGGFFRKHCDAPFRRSEDEMSLFTCMFYLNGDMEGGSTRFLDVDPEMSQENEFKLAKDHEVLASVKPEAGLCILFFQPGLMHEGEDLYGGTKYILRTDVMCRRAPNTKPELSSQKLEARALVRDAELAEERSECERARYLYRRAFKLDPELERCF